MDVNYKAKATAEGAGRAGHTRSDDGKVDFQLSIPKEMGGPGGVGHQPRTAVRRWLRRLLPVRPTVRGARD